jgi:plastocyanin
MKTEFVVLVAVVLVASGCASNSTETPDEGTDTPPEEPQDPGTSPSNTSENATVVTYSSSGFQPGTVTVQQGETVIWQSEASRPMWVASNQHPVHSQYAGSSLGEHCSNGDQTTAAFDQCSTGERFSFTFEKTGEWSYHNHEYSPHTGTVIVE